MYKCPTVINDCWAVLLKTENQRFLVCQRSRYISGILRLFRFLSFKFFVLKPSVKSCYSSKSLSRALIILRNIWYKKYIDYIRYQPDNSE